MSDVFPYTPEFLTSVLQLCLKDIGFLSFCADQVKPKYFEYTFHRWYYKAARNFYLDHKVIIDDVSMVTISLMAMVYDTYFHDFALTLVGDINQLPPIGWGFFFKELLKAEVIPVFMLNKNLRVKNVLSNDCIVINIHIRFAL